MRPEMWAQETHHRLCCLYVQSQELKGRGGEGIRDSISSCQVHGVLFLITQYSVLPTGQILGEKFIKLQAKYLNSSLQYKKIDYRLSWRTIKFVGI
jgi:hypothetical protein